MFTNLVNRPDKLKRQKQADENQLNIIVKFTEFRVPSVNVADFVTTIWRRAGSILAAD